MNIFIIDDEISIRNVLKDIIDDYNIGNVVGDTDNATLLIDNFLLFKNIDLILVDLMLPTIDGLELVKNINDKGFNGSIVMISGMDSKDIIASAYNQGVEYYITKPINRIEVMNILLRIKEKIQFKKSLRSIQETLKTTLLPLNEKNNYHTKTDNISLLNYIANDLGVLGTPGYSDIILIIEYLKANGSGHLLDSTSFKLREVYTHIAKLKLGSHVREIEINKETKAIEQRLRRTVFQSLINFSNIGLVDYSNVLFEKYAVKFFEFQDVRKVMDQLSKGNEKDIDCSINIKKFLIALYNELNQINLQHQ